MSRTKRFCHGSSLNGLPCPAPLGIVKRSMNAMTRSARFLSREQALELRSRRLEAFDGNSRPGDRCESELSCICHHVPRGAGRDADERALFQDAPPFRSLVDGDELAGLGECFLGLPPTTKRLAVGRERVDVDDGQEAEPIELG